MKRIPFCEAQTNTFCEKDTLADSTYQFIWISNSAFSPNYPPGMSKVAPAGCLCLPFGVQITGALGAHPGFPLRARHLLLFHFPSSLCCNIIISSSHSNNNNGTPVKVSECWLRTRHGPTLPAWLSSSAPHHNPWQRDRLSCHLMEEVTGRAVQSSDPATSPTGGLQIWLTPRSTF